MPSRDKESYSIQAVENALDVLEALSEIDDDVRISQLSEKLAMNKTSVFRLLATFENRGYVEREEQSGKYRLGLSAYEIGQKFLSRMGLLRHAKPLIERLARGCNEAVYVAVRRRKEVLFLDMVDTTQKVKIVSLVGKRFPLETTAAGQVLLAMKNGQSLKPAQGAPEDISQFTNICRQGYALDSGALGEGIASVAAPLFGSGGKLHGVLCVVGPEYRLSQEVIESQIISPMFDTCGIISSKLGWHSPYVPRNLT
ncbi:IclR family transcriptional regulator [Deltaproteobacteria bacterium IMCC39524]|nr:IclR family transcriptional regulator [Deltaproteobacteria bacterium IMCC39524]